MCPRTKLGLCDLARAGGQGEVACHAGSCVPTRPILRLVMPRERVLLALLLVAHVLLGIYYSVAIPIWEAHDEIGHYYFVRYLAQKRALPPPGTQLVEENDESRQPPLYHILAAVPVALLGGADDIEPHPNPHMLWPRAQGGANRVIHDPEAERWPYQGTTLAVHLARWVSVVLGACGLLFTYQAAKLVFPTQPLVAWGAVLFQALWPQYRFSTAVINNDIMATVCTAALTYLLLRTLAATVPKQQDVAALLLASGLALLAKNTTLAILPIIALVLAATLFRLGSAMRRRYLLGLGGGVLVAVGMVGWWYARNLSAGSGMFGGSYSLRYIIDLLTLMLQGRQVVRWPLVPPALRAGLLSLWASFGWNNVGLPLTLYGAAAVWAALGALGLAIWYVRRPPRNMGRAVGVLLLIVACTVAAWLLFTVSGGRTDLPGRYLLPALPAISILLSIGWNALLPKPIRAWGLGALVAALALLAVLIPSRYIAPAYALPPEISEAEAREYTPLHLTFGGFAELVGYRIEDTFVDRESTLHLTLAWRALQQTETDYSLAVQVFAPRRRLLGEVQTFPGRGALATSTWQPGTLFTQDVAVRLDSRGDPPFLAWLELSFFDRLDVGRPIAVYDAQGNQLNHGALPARIKVRGAPAEQPALRQEDLWFGPAIRLVDGQAALAAEEEGTQLALELRWVAASRPEADYTISLQLRDKQDRIIAQVDTQPRKGTLPTLYWEPGEVIPDRYELPLPASLPPDTYTLYLCVYHLPTLQRLPARDAQGQQITADEVPLVALLAGAGSEIELAPLHPLVRAKDSGSGLLQP